VTTETKWQADNAAAMEAGKRGVRVPPKGTAARRNLSLAEDREDNARHRRFYGSDLDTREERDMDRD
jgi:hypothetical protein